MKNESKNRQADNYPEFSELKLGDIINAAELQEIADDFFSITNVGIGIIDMEGNIFVANGWQDICTKFHRVNPETCKNCIESDILLSKVDVRDSSSVKAYKCKNNLWDISTPLIIDGKQYGNIFLGQFFYDDETPDYELFKLQAQKYGFDEKAYLDALDRVPRWSKSKVDSVIRFYSQLADYISRISLSNLKIKEALQQKQEAEKALENNYTLLRIAGKTALFGGWQLNLATKNITLSDEVAEIHEMPAGYSPKLNEGIQFYAPEWRDKIAALVANCAEKGIAYDDEFELITAKGNRIWVRATGEPVRNSKGKITGLQGAFQDISQQKREAELLKQSEEKFRLLYENMAEGVFFQSADGKLIDINSAGLKMFGISKEQFLERTSYHPEWNVVDEHSNLLSPGQFPSELAINTGKEIQKTIGVFNPARKSFSWLMVNAKPQFNGNSEKPSHVFVTMHDITDIKLKEAVNNSRLHLTQFAQTHTLDELLEETLNEAEKLTNSKIGFFHFVDENQEQLHLQNWSSGTKKEFCKAEGKGAHYNISEAGVWVECFYTKQPVIHNNYAALPNKKGMPVGHASVIRELVVPIISAEKVVAILGVGNKPDDYNEQDVNTVSTLANLAWEITGRKRAEEALQKSEKKYRRLAENLSDVIWTTDLDFDTLYTSRSCERMYGYKFEDYIQLPFEQKFTPESQKKIKQVFAEQLNKENNPAEPKDRSQLLEVEHYKADGSTIWIGMNLSFTRDEPGKITGIQGVSRDITERKKAEFALQKSEEQANA
ncbi:MAG: PocR ligand-binding domain-containing protein, partial [Draconibacterium sp.]